MGNLHPSPSHMSLFKTALSWTKSLIFSSGGEEERQQTRVRPREEFTDLEFDVFNNTVDGEDEPRQRRRLSRSERAAETSSSLDKALGQLSDAERNMIAVSMYQSARKALIDADRTNFKEEEKNSLLASIRSAAQLESLTWEALLKRVARVANKGTFDRAPGSGRPRKFTSDMRDRAIAISRDADHELSRAEIYHTLCVDFPQQLPSLRTCYRHFAKIFVRRRIRLVPRLLDHHKTARVTYARDLLEHPGTDCATIYVDEKLFKGPPTGVLNIPIGDTPRPRTAQSKTNVVEVMALVAVLHPSIYPKGIFAVHYFLNSDYAAKSSRNREAGVQVLKTINVSTQTYLEAFEKTILPALDALIQAGEINIQQIGGKFFLQDDNARPHRGMIDGVCVTDLICQAASKKGIVLAPKSPAQPAQSPDLNVLDLFIFRVLYFYYRSLRARARVMAIRENRALLEDDVDGALVEVDQEEREGQISGLLPMRCRAPGASLRESGRVSKRAMCPGCRKPVKDTDRGATQCDLRNGWWHKHCVQELLESGSYDRTEPVPDPDEEDAPWVCPHCSHFLCANADRESHLCVACWKPTARFGDDEGTDMIVCDGPGGGLFHKTCVRYRDDKKDPPEDWRCPACEVLGDDEEWVELETVSEAELGGNNLAAIRASIEKSVEKMQQHPQVFVRGFETRRAVLEKIVECGGGNNYSLHWRAP